ncbi:hypothetical protein [Streptomyces sp. JB150]|uniref:hypothetical protein n=1 Tax=Streptomyces sp. JB150 TaxID=2714844 RepID=UPI001F10694E|nr:hypothetical protein [Streptomyces sp. JB150]
MASAAALGAATAVTLAGVVGSAPPAVAGGPTSVLVVAPSTAEAAGLTYSDEKYGELDRLLGRPGAGSRTEPPEADLTGARQINVTWLLHDVDPWRMNRVFVHTGSETVWIHTAATRPRSENGSWHRAEQPAALRALLAELGVMGRSLSHSSGEPRAAGPVSEPVPSPDRAAASPGTGSGWSWALPALGAGLAIGAGGSLLIRRAAARQDAGPPREEPRQELIDR